MRENFTINEVTSKREQAAFIDLPYQLNRGIKNWIPPLRISQKEILDGKHPFWKINAHRFFLAMRGHECVGRIAAFVHHDDELSGNKREGFFGFLDAIDDPLVFQLLFQHAEEFLISQECEKISGPFSPSIHYELGVLVEGFDFPPYFMLPYNQPYYDRCVTACGYSKLKDFYAYNLDTKDFIKPDRVSRVSQALLKKYNIKLRQPDLSNFDSEIKIFFDLYNDAFIGHWGFSPMRWDDFQFLAKDMKFILDREMILIAEKDNQPVAFLLAIPNLNEALVKIRDGKLFPFGLFKLLFLKRKIQSLRVITVAVCHQWRHLGIGSLLYPEIAERAKKRGYIHTEFSWVVEDNLQMNKVAKLIGGHVNKRYRLYWSNLSKSKVPSRSVKLNS